MVLRSRPPPPPYLPGRLPLIVHVARFLPSDNFLFPVVYIFDYLDITAQ